MKNTCLSSRYSLLMAFACLCCAAGCAPADEALEPGGADGGLDAVLALDVLPNDASATVDSTVDAALDPALRFAFPIHPDDRLEMHPSLIFGVDHDPAEGERAICTNYADQPFPFCYDEHDGSDFMLSGGFERMDGESARVVAAAAGEVYRVVDGNYDRCHGDWSEGDISCDGHPVRANYVRIRHANGWKTFYYHLKTGSPAVSEGDFVSCGDLLGLVGSSGRSYMPHLHFEVEDDEGQTVDPYGGTHTQNVSHWTDQSGPDGLPGPDCHPAWTTP